MKGYFLIMIRLIGKLKAPRKYSTTLTLPWDQRIRSRLRIVLDNGEDAGIFLERGTILREKDLLVSDDGYVVEVRAADETLSTVICDDMLLMARVCYHLGNRHAPLEIMAKKVRYQHDPILDDMVTRLGLEVEIGEGPFEPEIGAYTTSEHHHA
jgi:urease accessory protein